MWLSSSYKKMLEHWFGLTIFVCTSFLDFKINMNIFLTNYYTYKIEYYIKNSVWPIAFANKFMFSSSHS